MILGEEGAARNGMNVTYCYTDAGQLRVGEGASSFETRSGALDIAIVFLFFLCISVIYYTISFNVSCLIQPFRHLALKFEYRIISHNKYFNNKKNYIYKILL